MLRENLRAQDIGDLFLYADWIVECIGTVSKTKQHLLQSYNTVSLHVDLTWPGWSTGAPPFPYQLSNNLGLI